MLLPEDFAVAAALRLTVNLFLLECRHDSNFVYEDVSNVGCRAEVRRMATLRSSLARS